MFRVVFRPSSGAHNTVSAVSVINEACTATCPERGCTERPATFRTGSSTGLINPLTPNDYYNGRTAPLTSKRFILYIYSTNISTEYFKRGIYSLFFFLFKMQLVS